jgi:hypothetical protein
MSKRSQYDQMGAASRDVQQSAYDKAFVWGAVSTGLTVAAVAGAGVTGYAYFTRPTQPADARVGVAPILGLGVGGVSVAGSFF